MTSRRSCWLLRDGEKVAFESPSRDRRWRLSWRVKVAWNAGTTSSVKRCLDRVRVAVRPKVGGETREIGERKAGEGVGEVLTERETAVVHGTGRDGRPKPRIFSRTLATDGDDEGGDEKKEKATRTRQTSLRNNHGLLDHSVTWCTLGFVCMGRSERTTKSIVRYNKARQQLRHPRLYSSCSPISTSEVVLANSESNRFETASLSNHSSHLFLASAIASVTIAGLFSLVNSGSTEL